MAERRHSPGLLLDGADLAEGAAVAAACVPAGSFGKERAECDQYSKTASSEKNGKNNGFIGGFRKQDRHGQDYRKQD